LSLVKAWMPGTSLGLAEQAKLLPLLRNHLHHIAERISARRRQLNLCGDV